MMMRRSRISSVSGVRKPIRILELVERGVVGRVEEVTESDEATENNW